MSVWTETYFYVHTGWWDQYADERTLPWVPGGPWWLFGVITVYLTLVLVVGPSFMKNRRPFELRRTMAIYNAANVASVLNVIIFAIGAYLTNWTAACWGCGDLHEGVWKNNFFRVAVGYIYIGLKIFDLLDTIFFVLRKKNNQITFLHIVHHSIMPLTVWFALKYIPTTTSMHTLIINSFVHSIMYYYYYLAGKGKMRNQYGWKKFVTTIQLVQFVLAGIHASHLLFDPSCNYPRPISLLELCEAIFFFYTFYQFYMKTYVLKIPEVNNNAKKIKNA